MRSLFANVSKAVLMLATVFTATPVFAGHVLDFQVLGKGTVSSDCIFAIVATDCEIVLSGQASGTHIDQDDFRLTLRVDSLSQRLGNGSGPLAKGLCVVVAGTLELTPPSVNAQIFMKVAGTVCEENGLGSNAQFDGTYRITDGTAWFENRSGGGSLTATYVRGFGQVVYLHLHGTIDR